MLGGDARRALGATEAAVPRCGGCSSAMLPFPGGIVRSGSKVGSRYQALMASTEAAMMMK